MEQKELFKEAIELFEAGEYDKSVQNLIGLYEHGYEKEQILNFLYQAFVEPNIEEFKKNYQTQADGLIDVEYEATQLDFIPVSDQKFYIWYKEEQRFVGNIDLNVEAQIEDRQRDFQSLLIAQTCDIREMIPFLLNKQYNTVYIVLNKNKEIFASFLKLPKIREYFLEMQLFLKIQK